MGQVVPVTPGYRAATNAVTRRRCAPSWQSATASSTSTGATGAKNTRATGHLGSDLNVMAMFLTICEVTDSFAIL